MFERRDVEKEEYRSWGGREREAERGCERREQVVVTVYVITACMYQTSFMTSLTYLG